jgi:hypothetical protein
MKKTILTLGIAMISQFSFAQSNTLPSDGNVGVGTLTPGVKLTTRSGVNALPAPSGSNQPGGAFRVEGGDNAIIDFGTYSIYTWIQATDKTDLSYNYKLSLNPNGGNVGVGTLSPGVKLTTRSGVNALPAPSGTNQPGGAFRIEGGDNAIIDFGTNSSYTWIQATDKIELSNNYKLGLNPNGGNVGIGTAYPNAKLHVQNGDVLISKDLIADLGAQLTISNGYGNQSGAVKLNFNNGGAVSWIKGLVTGPNTDTGSALVFGVASNTSEGGEVMRITGNGYLGIGTTMPDSRLSVNGTIHSNEVKVDSKNWPDYVFKSQYRLRPLTEVKTYIDKNQHLPEMPSAGEVEKDGLNVGEMNKLLTKKIEELTLYLIEQNKVNQDQQKQINGLKTELTRLANQ